MDINTFDIQGAPERVEEPTCTFSESCTDYVSGTKCDNPELYREETCHQTLSNQRIAKNSQWLLGDQFNEPSKVEVYMPMTREQMSKLATTTHALFNGGKLIA